MHTNNEIGYMYLCTNFCKGNIENSLSPGTDVIIYGAGTIGRILYNDIKKRVNVLAFLDGFPSEKEYDNIPIYKVTDDHLRKITEQYNNILVVVTPSEAFEEIKWNVQQVLKNALVIPIETLFAMRFGFFYEPDGTLSKMLSYSKPQFLIERIGCNRVYITGSLYTTLIYMLMFDDWDKSYMIFDGNKKMDTFVDRLSLMGVPVFNRRKITKHSMPLPIFRYWVENIRRYIIDNNIPIYGRDDARVALNFLDLGFHVIEDGTANYNIEAATKYQTRVTLNGERFVPYGFNRFTKEIFLVGLAEVPNETKEITHILDMQELWNKKSKEAKTQILEAYQFPLNRLRELMTMEKRDCVLFTGNYYAWWTSEEEQIAAYKEIISHYGEHRIIIKPHPCDELDYKKFFPDCEVISGQFPAELIQLTGLPIAKNISISSTCSYHLFPKEKVDTYEEYAQRWFAAYSKRKES